MGSDPPTDPTTHITIITSQVAVVKHLSCRGGADFSACAVNLVPPTEPDLLLLCFPGTALLFAAILQTSQIPSGSRLPIRNCSGRPIDPSL
jgi:hypothetical protein